MESYLNISESTRYAINMAQSYAKEYNNEKVGVSHLLKALVHEGTGLHDFLKVLNKDILYISEWAEVRICEYPGKINKSQETYPVDRYYSNVIEESDKIRIEIGLDLIDPICLLAAIVKPNYGYTVDQLKSLPLHTNEILEAYLNVSMINKSISKNKISDHQINTSLSTAINSFCINKNLLVSEVNVVVGRDKELNMMMEILGRCSKPNVLLIGEPGVGKSALVDSFVAKINSGEVSSLLKNSVVFELEISSLLAGASYKGEVEDRLKKIIKDLKKFDKAILFIDEFHSIIDNSGSLGYGIANLLKPELARGELTIIGATTHGEYRKFIERDAAFDRRFEILIVNEPDVLTAIKIIQSLLPFYEDHHGIKVSSEVVSDCVHLAKRYIKDKRLPDSAIDLLDRTLSAVKVMNENSFQIITGIENELMKLIDSVILKDEIFLAELKWVYASLFNKISPILAGQLDNIKDISLVEDTLIIKDQLKYCIDKLLVLCANAKNEITSDDILLIVADKIGIPVGKIQTQERDKLLTIEPQLQKRVVGQNNAIKILSDAIIESRSGINKQGQPIGSFFFLGPTGTGKTELAKSVAEFLFNDEKAMIRFDMSEFKEEHSAALLYGSSPGYVGYEEGGMLVNKIRQRPYSVVLFDEIEKAHHSVFDIFLQIMDEGTLHDKLGKEGDFSNAIIIFTSNIASDWIVEQFQNGIQPSSAALMDIMSKSFRPEFLARVSEIIPFTPIVEEHIVHILEIQLRPLFDKLLKKGILIDMDDISKRDLALSGFTSRYGVRQLTSIMRRRLNTPISRMLVSGELVKGDTLKIRLKKSEEFLFTIIHSLQDTKNEFEPILLHDNLK